MNIWHNSSPYEKSIGYLNKNLFSWQKQSSHFSSYSRPLLPNWYINNLIVILLSNIIPKWLSFKSERERHGDTVMGELNELPHVAVAKPQQIPNNGVPSHLLTTSCSYTEIYITVHYLLCSVFSHLLIDCVLHIILILIELDVKCICGAMVTNMNWGLSTLGVGLV